MSNKKKVVLTLRIWCYHDCTRLYTYKSYIVERIEPRKKRIGRDRNQEVTQEESSKMTRKIHDGDRPVIRIRYKFTAGGREIIFSVLVCSLSLRDATTTGRVEKSRWTTWRQAKELVMDKGSDPTAEITAAAAASLEKVSQEIEQQIFLSFFDESENFFWVARSFLLGVNVPPKYGPFNGTTGLKADERNNCTKGTMMKCLRSYARAITFQKNAHSGGNSPVHEFSFFLPILRILLFFFWVTGFVMASPTSQVFCSAMNYRFLSKSTVENMKY